MVGCVSDHLESKSARVRIEEAIREIGTLLVALAPLDAAFDDRVGDGLIKLLIFVTTGGTLFLFALWLERRGDARTRR